MASVASAAIASLAIGEAFALPPRYADMRAQAGEVASRFADRHGQVRLHAVEHGKLHPELWREIRTRGWPGLLVPAEHGGTEGGLLGYVLVLEKLAAANIILWMPVLAASIGYAIAQAGPDHARNRWLGRIAAGKALLGLAGAEPRCGHDVVGSKTTIRRDGNYFVINGVKAVTPGIDMVERVLVFGRDPDGRNGEGPQFTTVLVDPNSAVAEELPMRLRHGARQYQLTFNDAVVPAGTLVGAEGQGMLVHWPIAHIERMLTAALHLGAARYCIAKARFSAAERTVFAKMPIDADQAIAAQRSRLEEARLLVYRAAARFDAGADLTQVAAEANMAKALTADLVFDAADHAMQTLGPQAWDDREGLIDLYLDAPERIVCGSSPPRPDPNPAERRQCKANPSCTLSTSREQRPT